MTVSSGNAIVQPVADYRKIFPVDYASANRFIRDNSWIADTLTSYGISPGEALAVVFPELLRYNRLEDNMETQALQVFYIQWGHQYADFSIGRFQMKPSFALHLEKDAFRVLPHALIERAAAGGIACSDSLLGDREERIERLTSLQWQVRYLVFFFEYMDLRYSDMRWNAPAEKIRFYAAAYNCGYWKPASYIRKMMKKSFFKVSKLSMKAYCYADIAAFYYDTK